MAACINCFGSSPAMGYSNPMGGSFAPSPMMGQAPMGAMDPSQSAMASSMLNTQTMMMTVMAEMLMMLMKLMMPQQGQASGASAADSSNAAPAIDGGSSAAPPATGSSTSPGAVDASKFSGGTASGRTLAAAAENEANAEHSTGWCYRGVSRALRSIGVTATGESAYMAADQLARNPKMKEIKASREELPKLPPGAVVVWDKGPGHPHGHISVALGDGREASDHIQSQMKDLGGGDSFRVFMPV